MAADVGSFPSAGARGGGGMEAGSAIAADVGRVSDMELAAMAVMARERAYAPYSRFSVGAALLGVSGRVYLGCNVENAAFGPTCCAERAAFARAVCDGETEFAAIAVAGWPQGGEPGFATPCGMCRQVMAEFCDQETFRVVVASGSSESMQRSYRLGELLPLAFGPGSLSRV